MIFTIHVILSVGFIVLFVIRNQIFQGKTIVGCDKIDACCWSTIIILIQVWTTGKTSRKLAQYVIFSPPIIADTVSIFSIPFGPVLRKFSNLVSTFANIPRLGN